MPFHFVGDDAKSDTPSTSRWRFRQWRRLCPLYMSMDEIWTLLERRVIVCPCDTGHLRSAGGSSGMARGIGHSRIFFAWVIVWEKKERKEKEGKRKRKRKGSGRWRGEWRKRTRNWSSQMAGSSLDC